MLAKVLAAIIVAFVLMVYFGTQSHAATGATLADPKQVEVGRILDQFDPDVILAEDGLTPEGYEIFFPGRDVRNGRDAWKKMTPIARLAFLKKEGAALPRGLWVIWRSENLAHVVRRDNPDISDEGIQEMLGTLEDEAMPRCLASPLVHPDHCVIFFGNIAQPQEVSAAERQGGLYLWLLENKTSLDAVRRSSARVPEKR